MFRYLFAMAALMLLGMFATPTFAGGKAAAGAACKAVCGEQCACGSDCKCEAGTCPAACCEKAGCCAKDKAQGKAQDAAKAKDKGACAAPCGAKCTCGGKCECKPGTCPAACCEKQGCCAKDKAQDKDATGTLARAAGKADAAYPLETCVISGEKLGAMGEPYEHTVQGQVVKLCCNGCVKELEKDPAAALKKLSDARAAKAKRTAAK